MDTRRSLFSEVAGIVFLAVFLAAAYNAFSSKGIPLVRREVIKVAVSDSALFSRQDSSRYPQGRDSSDKSLAKVIAPLHERALAHPESMATEVKEKSSQAVYRVVSLEQMKRLLAEHRSVLFDAREAEAYRKGHIKGARNIYGLDADQHFEELAPMPRDTLVVIYCNNPECHLGRMLAEFMSEIGFKKLYLYDDGWDGWEKAKMPVDSSSARGS